MQVNAKYMRDVLQTLALHEATDAADAGVRHGSRIARIAPKSWQAEIIRTTVDLKSANDPASFKTLMDDRDVPVIFLPHDALITAEIIDRICRESPFNKMVIWEA
ncbi:MAG TPA: hypothetical protein VEF76_03995 [Patescibacteria group bacterium]|nr:hypothetical protein [Patescibacteria group bacterium]